LIKQGRVTSSGTSPSNSEISALLAQASTNDLQTANERFDLAHRHLDDKLSAGELGVPERTLRFWTARYRQAKENYSSGYVGLLPHTSRRGNRSTRLPDESRKLHSEFIKQDYETPKQKSKFAS
jgi:putative transposase